MLCGWSIDLQCAAFISWHMAQVPHWKGKRKWPFLAGRDIFLVFWFSVLLSLVLKATLVYRCASDMHQKENLSQLEVLPAVNSNCCCCACAISLAMLVNHNPKLRNCSDTKSGILAVICSMLNKSIPSNLRLTFFFLFLLLPHFLCQTCVMKGHAGLSQVKPSLAQIHFHMGYMGQVRLCFTDALSATVLLSYRVWRLPCCRPAATQEIRSPAPHCFPHTAYRPLHFSYLT